jgi:hypothetical protein
VLERPSQLAPVCASARNENMKMFALAAGALEMRCVFFKEEISELCTKPLMSTSFLHK